MGIVLLNSEIVWTPESLDFFQQAESHSLVLDLVVSSFGNQQAENFWELLIDALNTPEVLSKIKNIRIIDATYLYRYFHNGVLSASDSSQSTWYTSNKGALQKLKADFQITYWNDILKSAVFQESKEKILQEYYGRNCNDISARNTLESNFEIQYPDLKFRDIITAEAAVKAFRYNCDIDKALKFSFERCAYFLSELCGENLIFHKPTSRSIDYVVHKRPTNINQLNYILYPSNNGGEIKKGYKVSQELERSEIEAAVTNFMQNEVTNLNFFVIDKRGNLVYSNFALEKIVGGNFIAENIDNIAWKSTNEVILTGKTFVGEEVRDNGSVYFSMKSPLIIKGETKGAIGLSIDITDKKRVEEEKKKALDLEFLSRLQQVKINFQEEFTQFIAQMAHDITSPLASLEVFTKSCQQLSISQQFLLSSISSSIKGIADDLLKKYRYNKRELDASKKQVLMVPLALTEVINQKKLQYAKDNVRIDLSYDQSVAISCFINMDKSNFSRMISNLVNNAVEACKERSLNEVGIINVKFTINNQNVEIEISDNGNGMFQEMINNLMKNIPLKTTKRQGYGLGLCQVLENVTLYQGKLSVESKLGEGTRFKVMFPLQKQPAWITYKITLPPVCDVLVIDDGTGALSNTSKEFLKNNFSSSKIPRVFEKISDFEDHVSSLSNSEKEKVFIIMEYRMMNVNSEEILNIILRHNLMPYSLMITDACNDKRLQDFIEISEGKMVPKLFLDKLKTAN